MAGRPIPNALRKQMQKATVKHTDMPQDMLQDAIDILTGSIDKLSGADGINIEGAARLIKDSLDKQYGAQWHCVIGQGFSMDVTAQTGTLLYLFYQAEYAILVFKC
mmetsp:Transcript_35665/g.83462  ORF Transcript_35665/g.83462 Transcript_35665/m.83462 type:complete len:106 (+) Transcript_35665:97-414(+)